MYIKKNSGAKPPEASECFMWTNVFLLDNFYFKNFLYTAPGQPGGPRLYQGGRPPGLTLAMALNLSNFIKVLLEFYKLSENYLKNFNIFLKFFSK